MLTRTAPSTSNYARDTITGTAAVDQRPDTPKHDCAQSTLRTGDRAYIATRRSPITPTVT